MKKLMAACLVALAGCETRVVAPRGPTHVLCLVSEDLRQQGLDNIDPKALETYRAMGFELHFDYYQRVDEARLRRYPLVVGMMPMLHAGTRAIDERLGEAIERYVQDGGGFLLMPAPSYYGGEDFVRQLNPWLARFGCELLNEQPRDPGNQKVITRVVNYRYLMAGNMARHDVTKDVPPVWLPIDYTDAYVLTHTMKLSPDWTVLVRGADTCATFLYPMPRDREPTPGAYASAPPFLAARDWGRGRLAVFTTSSQYFIFDAYHWAYGDGFVMEDGHGRQLMANLFDYLARGQAGLVTAAGATADTLPPPPAEERHDAQGNVPLVQSKAEWLHHVQSSLGPPGFGVAGYVDCGSLWDRPYTPVRGWGYADTASWLIRWEWSEMLHPTAANSRGFDIKPLVYRFDGLQSDRRHALGVLLWAYQVEGARSLRVRAGGTVLAEQLDLPRYADQQGPRFTVLDVPAEAIREDGSIEFSFECTGGGTGTFSSVCELWLFDEGVSALFGAEAMSARFESPSAGYAELPMAHFQRLEGLVGARSAFSGGAHTVADLSAAAREAGYDFMVFTEDAAALARGDFEKLSGECERSSGEDFRALPGVMFSARYAGAERRADVPTSWGDVNAYVFQNIRELPQAADYGDPYSLFWKFFGGALCGGKGAPPTLATPRANAISPFYQRFWRGLDVLTLDAEGRVTEDARDLYADLVAHGYGPQPRVRGPYATPGSIRAAREQGWCVDVFAPNLADVEAYAYGSCVSRGIEIREIGFSFDYARHGWPGEGLLFRDAAWLVLRAELAAPAPIERVTLYSGQRPLRTWYPAATTFRVEEPVLVAGNHELWLRAEAQGDRDAMTGRFLVQNSRFLIGMCADNQNTICSLTRPPSGFRWDDREMFLSHSYWHTGQAAGQIGAMRDARELVPRVIETGIVQPVKHFHPCPLFRFSDGATEDHTLAELRLLRATEDYNQIEYLFDPPESRMRSRVLLTTPRPAEGGDTVVLVECEAEAKADVEFAAGPLAVHHLRMGLVPALAPGWKCSYVGPAGNVVTQPFTYGPDAPHIRDMLSPEGGVLVWPNDIGSLLLLPLDGTAYEMDAYALVPGHRRESVDLGASPQRMAAGERIRSRILVALHQGEVTGGEELRALRERYVGQARRLQVETGRLAGEGYLPVLETRDGVVAGSADTAGLTDPLPLKVGPLNPSWSVAKFIGKTMSLLEAPGGDVVVTLPAGQDGVSFVVGNALLSDRAELRMEWGGRFMGGVRLHLHNPGEGAQTFRTRTNPLMAEVPRVDGQWPLAPGESAWLWGHGDWLVRESGHGQVLWARETEAGGLELELAAAGAVEFTGPVGSVLVDGVAAGTREERGRFVFDVKPGRHTVQLRRSEEQLRDAP